LDFLKQNDKSQKLCFSFNKGSRILVYVRIKENNDKTNIYESDSYMSSKYISDMSEIIEDMYDIKNLTRKELIDYLTYYNVIDTDNMKNDELKILLLEKIKKKEFKLKPNKKLEKEPEIEELKPNKKLEKEPEIQELKPKIKAKKEAEIQEIKPKIKVKKETEIQKLKPKIKVKKEAEIQEIKPKIKVKKEAEKPEIKPKIKVKKEAEKPEIKPKITKAYLIELIKIKQPNKKGLTAKTKDELLLILNEPVEKTKNILSLAVNKKTKKDLIEEIKIKYPNLKNLLSKTKDQLIQILKN
jgi:hypothetical protein